MSTCRSLVQINAADVSHAIVLIVTVGDATTVVAVAAVGSRRAAIQSFLSFQPCVSSGTSWQRETFTKQVASRPDVALRLVDNGRMKKSVGRFPIHVGSTSASRRRALAGVVLLVSLAACGGTPSAAPESTLDARAATGSTNAPELAQVTTSAPPASTASESTVDAMATSTPISVPELLQFTAPLVGGGEFNGADRAGLATAFWFWAPT